MFCRLTALFVFLLLFLGVQSIDSIHARSVSSLSSFELPEIDGSAVDPCRIFFDPDTTTTTTTTKPITKKQVVATTKKPAVQSPPRKPETKNTRTPIRPQPAPAGPITDSLLYYLLANSRGRVAGSLPRFNSFISQPMRRLPQRGYGMTSDSDESAGTLPKRAGRTGENRWSIGSFSSEDSSDES